jgi:DNA-directed RNA polymerase specialized sigma24 family protein
VMCRVENRSHAQIAAELGVSIKMVEKYMTRALNELRASLASFLEGGVD